uniref:(northern house mosquito) hypothetical protein n=1 Tax=Culex pipiens TaxID=7175 RepID=A0A8D8C9W1_CULPI
MTNHSFQQQKMAAYHYFIHRMTSLPLSKEGRQKELEYIFETAKINGYSETTIQAIIYKKERHFQNTNSLLNQEHHSQPATSRATTKRRSGIRLQDKAKNKIICSTHWWTQNFAPACLRPMNKASPADCSTDRSWKHRTTSTSTSSG